jgi:hypothetical protein
VINRRIGRIHRTLRQRTHLTQHEVSVKSGVVRWKIGRLERDLIDRLRFDEVERCLAALGAELEVRVSYRGAEVDRLIDRVHSLVAARVVDVLRRHGWQVQTEVTFSEWGERGSYDILAWHPRTRTLLVIEVKSELASVEGTMRQLDVKVRLAQSVARKRFGWQSRAIASVLVLPEDRSARRQVTANAALLRATLPATSLQIRSWLRLPDRSLAGIWFVSGADGRPWPRNPSSIRRVRSNAATREAHLKAR